MRADRQAGRTASKKLNSWNIIPLTEKEEGKIMTTIYNIVKTAREYNKAVDDVLSEHEGKGTIYSAYIPKLYDRHFEAEHAIQYLKDCMNEGERYDVAADNYAYFCREAVDEIIDGLRDAHELFDFQHMEENLEGLRAAYDYMEVIEKYWKNLL